jgi:mono/diheme cytochrome c family protein
MVRHTIPIALGLILALAACGSDGGPDLSPAAEAGRDVFRSNGCASCHGANGQGGVGPTFEGLYGREVELDDGSTVTADDAYLRESITDPSAKIVDGYALPMPTNDLSDDEIDQVISFIAELGGGTP